MNTLLMEAYENLQKIRAKRSGDPQDAALMDAMEVLWRSMGEDEVTIMKNRAFLKAKNPRFKA